MCGSTGSESRQTDKPTVDLAAGTHTITIVLGSQTSDAARLELADVARLASASADCRGQIVGADTDAPVSCLRLASLGPSRRSRRKSSGCWPAFRFAYSRPGFLTFKLPANAALADDFRLDCTFARASACSLGKINDPDLDARARAVWQLAGSQEFDALHVWQRDMAKPGWRGFEPHSHAGGPAS